MIYRFSIDIAIVTSQDSILIVIFILIVFMHCAAPRCLHWTRQSDRCKSFELCVSTSSKERGIYLRGFAVSRVHSITDYQNQKELYCQVCLHTQGICLGVRSFRYRNNTVQTDNSIMGSFVFGESHSDARTLNSVHYLCLK